MWFDQNLGSRLVNSGNYQDSDSVIRLSKSPEVVEARINLPPMLRRTRKLRNRVYSKQRAFWRAIRRFYSHARSERTKICSVEKQSLGNQPVQFGRQHCSKSEGWNVHFERYRQLSLKIILSINVKKSQNKNVSFHKFYACEILHVLKFSILEIKIGRR